MPSILTASRAAGSSPAPSRFEASTNAICFSNSSGRRILVTTRAYIRLKCAFTDVYRLSSCGRLLVSAPLHPCVSCPQSRSAVHPSLMRHSAVCWRSYSPGRCVGHIADRRAGNAFRGLDPRQCHNGRVHFRRIVVIQAVPPGPATKEYEGCLSIHAVYPPALWPTLKMVFMRTSFQGYTGAQPACGFRDNFFGSIDATNGARSPNGQFVRVTAQCGGWITPDISQASQRYENKGRSAGPEFSPCSCLICS